MGKLIRCITSDGTVMAAALDSTDIVAKAESLHRTSAVVTAALGRLLTATSLMGDMLKGADNSVTVRIDGGGQSGALIASADSHGNVRGYAVNPVVEIPLKPNGKLDVSGAVGTAGNIFVTKDLGLKEPYNGCVPLASGEIAEDITAYYAVSEQIPTVCALGVLVNPDLTVRKSGGYIIQLLPSAQGDEAIISRLEENIRKIKPVTELLDSGMDIEAIVRLALEGFEVEVLDTEKAEYKCNCSRQRFEKALMSIDLEELRSMANEMPFAETQCQFCNSKYIFTKADLEAMVKKREKN